MTYRIQWWKSKPSKFASFAAGKAIFQKKLSEGEITKDLENKIRALEDCNCSIMTPSGSTALLLGMKALGLQAGDEVIVPNLTWIATANAAHTLGAKVILADTNLHNGTIDLKSIEKLISPKTKLIVPVVLNGHCPDMKNLSRIINTYKEQKIRILVDSCQAFGCQIASKFKGYYDAIAFSFAVTKVVTSGQGGALCTNDKDIEKNARLIKNNGCKDIRFPLYLTDGLNLKYSDILASVLNVNINNLNSNIKKIKKLRKIYEEHLDTKNIARLIDEPVTGYSIYNFLEIYGRKRSEIMNIFKKYGIETRVFPDGLSLANHLKQEGLDESNKFSRRLIYLPSGPEQNTKEIARIISQIDLTVHL